MRVLYMCAHPKHHASVSSTALSSFIDPEDEQGGDEGCTPTQEEEKSSLAGCRALPVRHDPRSCPSLTLHRPPSLCSGGGKTSPRAAVLHGRLRPLPLCSPLLLTARRNLTDKYRAEGRRPHGERDNIWSRPPHSSPSCVRGLNCRPHHPSSLLHHAL
ncbi:unnamed protein product [Triticum turgidum subsp. durum]|uniref:Uncharacterized protein n=1 Tax=Triticum turgidum subsp. durum TaxID=4567 RepID=A0A9R0X1G8_TRITD|nr:unnamed protein product [Triticum turgidum subsp. durum]